MHDMTTTTINNMTLTLTRDADLTNHHDEVTGKEVACFEAPAKDAAGNEYRVEWDILSDFEAPESGDDCSDACDWDHADRIYAA